MLWPAFSILAAVATATAATSSPMRRRRRSCRRDSGGRTCRETRPAEVRKPDRTRRGPTVEIDTTGGPASACSKYKAYDYILEDKEVIPDLRRRPASKNDEGHSRCPRPSLHQGDLLLDRQNGARHAEIIREVHARGQTVGTHTWSHANVKKKGDQDGKDEIERGISAVRRAVGAPIAPFFRFPFLSDSPTALTYLASRTSLSSRPTSTASISSRRRLKTSPRT